MDEISAPRNFQAAKIFATKFSASKLLEAKLSDAIFFDAKLAVTVGSNLISTVLDNSNECSLCSIITHAIPIASNTAQIATRSTI